MDHRSALQVLGMCLIIIGPCLRGTWSCKSARDLSVNCMYNPACLSLFSQMHTPVTVPVLATMVSTAKHVSCNSSNYTKS